MWFIAGMLGVGALLFTHLTVSCLSIGVSYIRDKQKLFTIGERMFHGILLLLVSAFCVLASVGLGYAAFNFCGWVQC